jgi:hypothetical protein
MQTGTEHLLTDTLTGAHTCAMGPGTGGDAAMRRGTASVVSRQTAPSGFGQSDAPEAFGGHGGHSGAFGGQSGRVRRSRFAAFVTHKRVPRA